MAVIKAKPTSPGRRGVISIKSDLHKGKPHKALLEKKLALPAYDQCLKASHIFNLMDSRGIIGVAQRTEYISRIRELAKGSGQCWLESQT